MAQLDDLYTALKNADAAGDTAGAQKLAAYIRGLPAAAPAAAPVAEESLGSKVKQGVGNLAAGAVRGAGSIGATLMAPIDMASDALDGKGLSLESNRQRRADMDSALQTMGAQPDSLLYQTGKLGGELAGTAGAGGVMANGLARVPGLAAAAPNLLNAVRTGGMAAGNGGNALANLATRTAGGAITGAASAGLVNPEDAGTGALIGGAMPGVLKAAGAAGSKIGNALRGPQQTADMAAAVTAARGAGYVIPPTQANPTMANRLLEGFSGKLTTAQNASAKNQAVTNSKVATALGLAPDVKITPDVLNDVRKTAGAAYDAIGSTGTVTPGNAYADALDKIAAPFVKASQGFPNAKASPVIDLVESLRSPSFDAGSAVAKLKELRTAADDAFRTGNTDVARASKSAAAALESALEDHLTKLGNPEALKEFRAARELIAKTYSVQKAMVGETGTIDARKLAAQLERNKPLSGDLREVAQFASKFKTAANTPERMGSLPGTSPLDWAASSGISAATGNPLAMLGVMARPAARAATLSPMVQNRLVQGAPRQVPQNALSLLQGGYRAAPLIGADR